jgi:hypothetical protein
VQSQAHSSLEDVRYNISAGRSSRGVYLRQAAEVQHPSVHTITVTPAFHEDAPPADKVGTFCCSTYREFTHDVI